METETISSCNVVDPLLPQEELSVAVCWVEIARSSKRQRITLPGWNKRNENMNTFLFDGVQVGQLRVNDRVNGAWTFAAMRLIFHRVLTRDAR